MQVGAIIFSRMTSERLPGKPLIEIAGRALLGRVIDRTRHINGIDKIVIATSVDSEDDEIDLFAKEEEIDVYRGSLEDVAGRAMETCNFFNLDAFARICGDRPFFDPELISSLIMTYNNIDVDVVTTTFPRTYPPGLTGEIINANALRFAITSMTDIEDKEHLTNYFYSHSSEFSIKNISAPVDIDYSDINLCVDNNKDLLRAEWIASHVNDNAQTYAKMSDVISLARSWQKSS